MKRTKNKLLGAHLWQQKWSPTTEDNRIEQEAFSSIIRLAYQENAIWKQGFHSVGVSNFQWVTGRKISKPLYHYPADRQIGTQQRSAVSTKKLGEKIICLEVVVSIQMFSYH